MTADLHPIPPGLRDRALDALGIADDLEREEACFSLEIDVYSALLGEPIEHRPGGGRTYADLVQVVLDLAAEDGVRAAERIELALYPGRDVLGWLAQARAQLAQGNAHDAA